MSVTSPTCLGFKCVEGVDRQNDRMLFITPAYIGPARQSTLPRGCHFSDAKGKFSILIPKNGILIMNLFALTFKFILVNFNINVS